LCRLGRGASQVEKSPRLNWATQFLTMVYDGICFSNVSCRMALIFFGALPCRKKKLIIARVSMLLNSRASPDTLPFRLCNKKRLAIRRMNRPLFPTTLSIPSYDIRELGRANDLSVPSRSSEGAADLLSKVPASVDHVYIFNTTKIRKTQGKGLRHMNRPPLSTRHYRFRPMTSGSKSVFEYFWKICRKTPIFFKI